MTSQVVPFKALCQFHESHVQLWSITNIKMDDNANWKYEMQFQIDVLITTLPRLSFNYKDYL